MSIKHYIDDLASKGKHFFLSQDLKKDLELSDCTMWSSLSRLKANKEMASPAGYKWARLDLLFLCAINALLENHKM